MTTLRIALVTQWYPPEPVAQPAWIVDALVRRGAQVEVLTAIPNYPDGQVKAGYRASSVMTEEIDGVRVHRTPVYPDHGKRSLRRIANYVSWALSSAAFGLRSLRRADVALVYSSPATAALPAMVARRIFGRPYVLLVQDVWPDSIFASGFLAGGAGKLVQRAVGTFVDVSYRWSSKIVVISPGMKDLLVSRGVPSAKIDVIFNWVSTEESSIGEAENWRAVLGIGDDDFVLMYAGNHGAAQALDSVVKAFERSDLRAHLVLIGDGVVKADLQRMAKAAGLERVHFLDRQPFEVMSGVLRSANAQLVPLADRPLFAVTVPSKLQAALAAGMPVIVSAPGDAARLVNEVGAGLGIEPEDPEALAHAIQRMEGMASKDLHEMGDRGRAFYESHMSEKVGGERLIEILREVAATADVDGKSKRKANA